MRRVPFFEEKDGKATQIESQARDGSRWLAGSWVAVLSTATVTRNHLLDFAVAKRITSLSVKAIEIIDKRKAKQNGVFLLNQAFSSP